MVSLMTSGAVHGIGSFLVQVEVDASNGLPGLELVGLLNSEVREAKERVRVALRNIGVTLPPLRITVNLSPADLRKQGSAFDLPIAAGILECLGKVPPDCVSDALLIGELGLDGRVRPVRGVLPIVLEAKRQGCRRCIVPKDNEAEAALVEGTEIISVEDLQVFLQKVTGQGLQGKIPVSENTLYRQQNTNSSRNRHRMAQEDAGKQSPDFAQLGGSSRVRRAAEIAAAGFHHMLMLGPPGSGKTFAARCIPGILPPLTRQESLEVSAIYSVSGLWQSRGSLIDQRPFVSPHHTVTPAALTGGGGIPRPGAVSLAHRGVLFLDELTEFKRATLDLLRQPLEERQVHIARSYGSYTYPADFMLVAAANPCPCGYYPDLKRCRCRPEEVRRYLGRISGPVLDRIDLCVETVRPSYGELFAKEMQEESSRIRARVMQARARQEKRFRGSGILFNAQMGLPELKKFCSLEPAGEELLQQMFEPMGLSARGCHRILRVARTIADLAGSQIITREALCEALSFRADLGGEEERT